MADFMGFDQAPDFDGIANQLLEEGSEASPSYLHGGICGVLAGAGSVAAEDCLAAVSEALELGLHGELADSCLSLARATEAALLDEAFGFQLFLPDEEVELELRVSALAEWCRAFMASFALVMPGLRSGAGGVDEETGEVLKDIAAIADAALDAEADEDDAENHLFELTEYLRFGTLNLYMARLLDAEAGGPQERDAPLPGDKQ